MRQLFRNYFATWSRMRYFHSEPCTSKSFDVHSLKSDILKGLDSNNHSLNKYISHVFSNQGKFVRPRLILHMASACNSHCSNHSSNENQIFSSQCQIALISEMIHTASLIHDDIVDSSDQRRGKPSLHKLCGQKEAVNVGNFTISKSTMLLAQIGNPEIVCILSQVIDDLVNGEILEFSNPSDESLLLTPNYDVICAQRLHHYKRRIYAKTASLIANSCKSVAMLADPENDHLINMAYEYGKCYGMAFQLTDDILDLVGEQIGKPIGSDISLGLANAPVIYAATDFPELNPMIQRRFKLDGDIQKAHALVKQSSGIYKTKKLAEEYISTAVSILEKTLKPSVYRTSLISLCNDVLIRQR